MTWPFPCRKRLLTMVDLKLLHVEHRANRPEPMFHVGQLNKTQGHEYGGCGRMDLHGHVVIVPRGTIERRWLYASSARLWAEGPNPISRGQHQVGELIVPRGTIERRVSSRQARLAFEGRRPEHTSLGQSPRYELRHESKGRRPAPYADNIGRALGPLSSRHETLGCAQGWYRSGLWLASLAAGLS
jgi:hypothetical protein